MEQQSEKSDVRKYVKFGAMIATSGILMFGLMYLHTYVVDHVYWSDTRVYMTLIMVSGMALVMLGFMWSMYDDRRVNFGIIVGSIVLFSVALWLVRSQIAIDDTDYMEGMIPHHSIAILTSERAQIEDVRVRVLANEIIKAQRREIKEMDWLIEDIEANGAATTEEEAEARPVPDFEGNI